ncbi:hypothetical protein O6P43_009454 [Quillaja saponaria]|uniref:Uncharacterized protein n=1 Tax=Quillaja saponaria TaxID=32244 RepID=A0AAD7PYB6_QUISA|nr:hypothetical protein O6P43_009454 [Quillaja saponaria]
MEAGHHHHVSNNNVSAEPNSRMTTFGGPNQTTTKCPYCFHVFGSGPERFRTSIFNAVEKQLNKEIYAQPAPTAFHFGPLDLNKPVHDPMSGFGNGIYHMQIAVFGPMPPTEAQYGEHHFCSCGGYNYGVSSSVVPAPEEDLNKDDLTKDLLGEWSFFNDVGLGRDNYSVSAV